MSAKKILIPGGTGAMGVYLVPELLKLGYLVDVVSLDKVESNDPALRYFTADFKKPEVRQSLLENGYDAIVDFMIYNKRTFLGTQDFSEVYRELLSSCEHYIYFSTYRIYANEEHPIKENSPRLAEVITDPEYLAADDYSLYKAQGEDLLLASEYSNWTAVRPAITYSKRRFQLVTLEADLVIHRAKLGKTLVLPEEAMNIRATMSWAGDIAKMLARLLFNPIAKREIYSICTSEHRSWGEIAEYYRDLIGLKYITVPRDDFYACWGNSKYARYQLELDRLFDRVMDNSKILAATGLSQSELMPLYDGLKLELATLPDEAFRDSRHPSNAKMDEYLARL